MSKLPISTNEIVEFTPEHLKDSENPPIYLISVPTKAGRAKFRRDIGHECGNHSRLSLLQTLRDELPHNVAEHDLAVATDLVDQAIAAGQDASVELPDEIKISLELLEKDIRERSDVYSDAAADLQYFNEILPILSCKMFLKGWRNVDATFKRERGHVSDTTLEKIPDVDLAAIGYTALMAGQVDPVQEKNLPSPSASA